MSDINEAFTRNKFVDKLMSIIPQEPIIQSQYMYALTCIVFFGLLGYGLTSWYSFFTLFQIKYLFSGLFMTAIAFISFIGLKQVRDNYLMLKSLYSQPKQEDKVESKDEMLEEFNQ